MTAALLNIGTKICTGCGPQPFSAFGVHQSKGREGTLRSRCKACGCADSKKYAATHPEKIKANSARQFVKEHEHRVWCQRRGIDIDQLFNAVSGLRGTA